MTARLFCPVALEVGQTLDLPAAVTRHVQVLRLQPGSRLVLFNGSGGEYLCEVLQMGRSRVEVRVAQHDAVEREARRSVHLALGMPANERMDWLIEKATELGVASIQPLLVQRSVLRLSGDRADRKLEHWRAVAQAACEQSGRNRIPLIHEVLALERWFDTLDLHGKGALLLSLSEHASPLARHADQPWSEAVVLSGPEGGLAAAEESFALERGFQAVSLGERVLRADTAPLAALVALTLTR